MSVVTYQVRFAGPTNHRGARWYIVDLASTARRYVDFDYARGNGEEGKRHAIARAFPRSGKRIIHWSGQKGLSTYYTEILDIEDYWEEYCNG